MKTAPHTLVDPAVIQGRADRPYQSSIRPPAQLLLLAVPAVAIRHGQPVCHRLQLWHGSRRSCTSLCWNSPSTLARRQRLTTMHTLIRKETIMQYKTIVLGLLQEYPLIYDQLLSQSDAAFDPGESAPGIEGEPRSLAGTPAAGEAAERREPDRERGAGDSPQGTGGPFALRIASERNGTAFPRRGNGVYPSHASRVKASRQPLLDFNASPLDPLSSTPPRLGPRMTAR